MEAAISNGEAKMLRDSQLQTSWHAILQELGGSANAIVVVPIASFNVDIDVAAVHAAVTGGRALCVHIQQSSRSLGFI